MQNIRVARYGTDSVEVWMRPCSQVKRGFCYAERIALTRSMLCLQETNVSKIVPLAGGTNITIRISFLYDLQQHFRPWVSRGVEEEAERSLTSPKAAIPGSLQFEW